MVSIVVICACALLGQFFLSPPVFGSQRPLKRPLRTLPEGKRLSERQADRQISKSARPHRWRVVQNVKIPKNMYVCKGDMSRELSTDDKMGLWRRLS